MSLIYPSDASGCTNVLLIDNSVENYQLFADSVNNTTFPIIYSSTNSTKTALLTLLKTNFTTIERIGLVFNSLSQTRVTFLDNQPLFNNEEATPYSDNVDFIIAILNEFNIKNIDYLACSTLIFPNWINYYNILAKETSVIVGASNDRTGNIKYGGDWIMESTGQDIELIYFTQSIEYYQYLLDIVSGGSFFLIKNNIAYGLGNNNHGQLGNGDFTDRTTLTSMTTTEYDVKTRKYISCSTFHTIVLMTDGSIYGTGYNSYGQLGSDGQLGNGDFTDQTILTLIYAYTYDYKAPKYISCGTFHTVVLMSDGSIYGTGYNAYGQLGNGGFTDRTTLTLMTNTEYVGKTPKYISCGMFHTTVLMTDRSIYVTGYGNSILTLIDPITYDNKLPKYISCGNNHTIVLMTDGSIYGSGYNSYGQLGNGDFTNRSTLTEITHIGKTPKYISCVQNRTIVLMTDGSVYVTDRGQNTLISLPNATEGVTYIVDMNYSDKTLGVNGYVDLTYINSQSPSVLHSNWSIYTVYGVYLLKKFSYIADTTGKTIEKQESSILISYQSGFDSLDLPIRKTKIMTRDDASTLYQDIRNLPSVSFNTPPTDSDIILSIYKQLDTLTLNRLFSNYT